MGILIACSACQQLAGGQEQVGQCGQHIDLAAVLGHAPQPGLLKAELLLEYAEGMLHLGSDVGLGDASFRLQLVLNVKIPFYPGAGMDNFLLNLCATKSDRSEALAIKGWLVHTGHSLTPSAEQPAHYSLASRVCVGLPYARGLAPLWKQQERAVRAGA